MKLIASFYFASIAYAIVRYAAFAPTNFKSLPVFIVNKGVAMAAALCFVAAFLQQLKRGRGDAITIEPASWFRAGIFGAIWHIPMALAVLQPAYFEEFFAPAARDPASLARMSFAGELVFCFGGLAAGALYLLTRQHWTPAQRWRLSLLAMLVLLVHVLSMGYCRGLNIRAIHAYLPPMWILSAVGILIGFVALLAARPRREPVDPA